jgi:hypothetical protein
LAKLISMIELLGSFHALGGKDHSLGGFIPTALLLKRRDLGEIHGLHDALGRMQSTHRLLDHLVDDVAILNG